MKYVLTYTSSEDGLASAPTHFAEHRARIDEFHDAGTLLLVGPFSDGSGAMSIFTSVDAARAFVEVDPFVVNGVVASWTIREWHDVDFDDD